MSNKSLVCCAALALAACDNLHRSIYNLTSCPVQVTYSTGELKHHTVTLLPGESAGSIGGVVARLDDLSVKEATGEIHTYSEQELARLRPALVGEDRWVYGPSGLEFSRVLLPDPATPVEGPRPCTAP